MTTALRNIHALHETLQNTHMRNALLVGGIAALTTSSAQLGLFASAVWVNKIVVDILTDALIESREISDLSTYFFCTIAASAAVALVSAVALLILFGLPLDLAATATAAPLFMSFTLLHLGYETLIGLTSNES